MKATEIIKDADTVLKESIAANNNTEFSDEDVYSIAKISQLGDAAWQTHTADSLDELMSSIWGK
jgi:hypothetical protein